MSFHFGAQNRPELHSLLRKSLRLIGGSSIAMLAAGEALARPLGQIFVGYDEALLAMTVRAFRIYSFSFLLAGVAILGSSFFTALNDGLTSALISFLRTLVFQIAAVLLLPLVLELDGIWLSIVFAETMAVLVTMVFLLAKRPHMDQKWSVSARIRSINFLPFTRRRGSYAHNSSRRRESRWGTGA